MQCAVCKYKDNCKPRADEPLLTGCTSGHPMEFINPPEKWVLCPICGLENEIRKGTMKCSTYAMRNLRI